MAKSGARSPHPDPLPEGEGEDQRGDAATAAWLMTAAGVRARAHQILALAEAGDAPHFTYHPQRLAPTLDYVLATIRANHPDLPIPFHSRWRPFSVVRAGRSAPLQRPAPPAPPTAPPPTSFEPPLT